MYIILDAGVFAKDVASVALSKVKDFIVGLWENIETVGILTLSAFGLSNLIGELPFIWSLPIWMESAMFAPVAAVVGIKLLLWLTKWRREHR